MKIYAENSNVPLTGQGDLRRFDTLAVRMLLRIKSDENDENENCQI